MIKRRINRKRRMEREREGRKKTPKMKIWMMRWKMKS